MSPRLARGWTIALALSAVVALTGCKRYSVVRASNGALLVGRFIPPEAYAAYARGAVAEAEGHLDEAAGYYRFAAHADEEGPEAWTRLGAVLCASGHPNDGADAFDRALSADSDFAPAHRELARCILDDVPATALAQTERALILDPVDDEAIVIYVQALAKLGRHAEAKSVIDARATDRFLPPDLRDRMVRAAALPGEATAPPPETDARVGTSDSKDKRGGRAAVDAAIVRGDAREAQSLALRAGLAQGELAIRESALGAYALARPLASRLVDADPDDIAALVARLASTDKPTLVEIVDLHRRLIAHGKGRTLSPLARLVLAEVLLRWSGVPAATSVVEHTELTTSRTDPVEEAIRKRLASRLGG